MLSKEQIRRIRALSQKKYRDVSGCFLVEGEKMVAEALASDWDVAGVWRRDEVGQETMARISCLSSPSPVLAVVRKKPEAALAQPDSGLFLALDGIRDPGNLGTLLRIADWFGLDGVFASPDTVDLYNPKVVQATMGALFRVPFRTVELPAFCRKWSSSGGQVYGTFLDGGDMYAQPLATGADSPVVVVIGNEADGISPEVGAAVTGRLFIPPFPATRRGSESLNAAVAAAVALSEFRRRAR